MDHGEGSRSLVARSCRGFWDTALTGEAGGAGEAGEASGAREAGGACVQMPSGQQKYTEVHPNRSMHLVSAVEMLSGMEHGEGFRSLVAQSYQGNWDMALTGEAGSACEAGSAGKPGLACIQRYSS